MPTPEEELMAADEAISEMEDLLKSVEESEDEEDEEYLLKADDEDEDEDEDEEEEDEDEDEDEEEEDMDKSFDDLEALEDESGEQFLDAVPVLKSLLDADKKDRKLLKSVQVEMSIINDKLDQLFGMLKSTAALTLEQAKLVKSLAGSPSGVLKGMYLPSQTMQKSGENANGFSVSQVKHILLKGVKDKELDRRAITAFEQQGIITEAAEAYLAK